MKNLRAHHHLVIASLFMLGVTSIWSWGVVVFAAQADTTVEVWIGPPDSCPNVPGYQTSVPDGMLVDASGNCYTPAPPVQDLCSNINGDQETVPVGYYRDGTECYPQPVPPAQPKDVCPNINGIQPSVPDGYRQLANGNCVRQRQDQCQNIPGPQFVIPNGLSRSSDGTCYTPAAPVTPTPPNNIEDPFTPSTEVPPSAYTDPETLINVPAWAVFIVQPLVDLLPATLKQALRELPPEVAISFAYYVFAAMAIAGSIVGIQSLNIAGAAGRLAAKTKQKRNVVEEKYQFLRLVTHYLDSPLTSLKSVGKNELLHHVKRMQHDLDTDSVMRQVVEPQKSQFDHMSVRKSLLLWVPIVLMITIVCSGNFLFGIVGGIELGTMNLITQAVAFVLLGVFFYRTLRDRHLNQHELDHQHDLLMHEYVRDAAINDFIHSHILPLSKLFNQLSADTSTDSAALRQFNGMIDKLQLLAEIQVGEHREQKHFELRSLVDEMVAERHEVISKHRLILNTDLTSVRVFQHRDLFKFVLGSLIDNALSLSSDGGTVTISTVPDTNKIAVSFSDTTTNANNLVLSELQHSFDADGIRSLELDYDQAGLSLFLDKIIMDYVKGDITIRPSNRHGATLKMTMPA